MSKARVRLYYSDLPDTIELLVPTPESFGAMKLSAYIDRGAARDLFDLKELTRIGALNEEALSLARGLLGRPIVKQEFAASPTDEQWDIELAHQVDLPGRPDEMQRAVYQALAAQLGW